MAETTYALKDPNTSFYDDETKLEVTRDQKVQIGPGAGKKTMQMIASGGLVEVKGEPAPPTGFNENAGKGSDEDKGSNGGGGNDELELEDMTKAQLLEVADKYKVEAKESQTKADIIEAIKSAAGYKTEQK